MNQIEQGERCWEKYPRVGINFGNAYVHPPFPPRSRSAVFKATEEAGTILALQTLVAVIVFSLWQRKAIHWNQSRSGMESRGHLSKIINEC